MNIFPSRPFTRTLTALLVAVLLMSLCFAGTSADTVTVSSASELSAALSDAVTSGNTTIVYLSAGTSGIELSGSLSIPSNVTIDLSPSGGTLRVGSGGTLAVGGSIVGGSIEVSGGTLLRENGSSVTATITANNGGVVRGARVLSLENLSLTSGESISAITYKGLSSADTSAYVTRAATAVLYVRMTGSNYSSYLTIETVSTDAGNLFRLGTKYTDTLSLTYALTYGGLTDAQLSVLNPTSYTASDAATLLNNPTKEGFLFAGWTCESLGVTVPQEKMVIPEGTTGALTLIAMWVEAPAGSGKTGENSTSPKAAEDAQAQQENATQQQQEEPQQESTRRTRTASSGTKVTFTSDVDSVVPSLAGKSDGSSFPWGWMFGGLAALGLIAFFAARSANRRQR